MVHQGGHAVGECIQIARRTMDAGDRIVAGYGVGQPCGVDPHLLEENFCAVLLVPIQDAIENAHLGTVECKSTAFGLIDALFDFDPVPIEAQPAGVLVNLLPGALIFSGGIRTPAAPAVTDGDGFFDRVPRSPDASAHGVDDIAGVDTDFNRSRALRLGAFCHAKEKRCCDQEQCNE